MPYYLALVLFILLDNYSLLKKAIPLEWPFLRENN